VTFLAVHPDAAVRLLAVVAQLMLMGHRRIRITDVANEGPPLMVQVEHIDTPKDPGNNPHVKAYANEILACIREIVKLNPMFREHVQYFVQTADLNDPWRLVRLAPRRESDRLGGGALYGTVLCSVRRISPRL
jgi:ATP-dependent Lon protease